MGLLPVLDSLLVLAHIANTGRETFTATQDLVFANMRRFFSLGAAADPRLIGHVDDGRCPVLPGLGCVCPEMRNDWTFSRQPKLTSRSIESRIG